MPETRPIPPLRAIPAYDTWHQKKKDERNKPLKSASYGKGKQWRGAYQDGLRHAPHTKGFDTKAEANDWAQEAVANIKAGRHITKDAAKKMFKDWVWEWLNTQGVDDGTYAGYASNIRLILRYLKPHAVADVTEIHVMEMMADLQRKGYAYETRIAVHRLLSRIMGTAERSKLRVGMPCSRTTFAKRDKSSGAPRHKTYCPTLFEFWSFYEALSEDAKIGAILGVGLGLRVSEASGADITDVDWDNLIYEPGTQYHPAVKRNGEAIPRTFDARLKTITSESAIPVDPWIADQLLSLLGGRKTGPFLRFTGGRAQGQRMPAPSLSSRVQRAVLEIGGEPAKLIPFGPNGEMRCQMGFHSLRKLYGSIMSHGRYSPADIQRRMRHKNLSTTLDIYTNLVEDTAEPGLLTLGETLRKAKLEHRKATTALRAV
ncbi:tyrosine-type recombinase/integrase [Nocardia brasiliensis]|uniref:tyrosine-type recombinase/integrase n=1 Tax=Nocardia brasiliensis TaxID=37326 RepID=UPI002453D550|nr:site-specific integrase [Nocardia brasiliensis]